MHRKYIITCALIFLLLRPATGEGVHKINLSKSFASFIGESKYDNASEWASSIGDVNGDGLDDLMIGAKNNDEGGDNAGKCYLFFGKPSGWKTDVKLSDADVVFVGEAANNNAGASGSGLGDVNGDGIDDFIVGAPYFTSSEGENVGKAYLFFGRKSGWEKRHIISSCNVMFFGERNVDNSANSLASAGDVNGDGLMDILIAAKNNDDGGENAGKVYLVLGREKWVLEINLSDADASFIGREKGDAVGGSIASAGDVNGDGYDDFLIGASKNIEGGFASGQVYLMLGKKDGWSKSFDMDYADVTFTGEKGDVAGTAVSSAGDIDNDGLSDFLISAPYNGEGGRKAGKVYLFYGRGEGWKRNFSLKEADVSFVGEKKKDNLGKSLAFCKDVNGDGIDDFLISAHRNSEGGSKAGKIYLFLGKSGERFPAKQDIAAAEYQFLGERKKDYAGSWVSFGGDVDGDGVMELIIGAESGSKGGKSAGQAYLAKISHNTPPTQIKSVAIKSDATYEEPLETELESGDTLYVEIRAEDPDADNINLLEASVGTGKLNRIRVFLTETDKNSGIFRGDLTLSYTGRNWLSRRLSVKSGDTIIVMAKVNQKKYAMVSLKVAFDNYLINDENLGKSQGNNNNHLEPGETVALKVQLINRYFETVKNLRAELACSDPYVTLKTNQLEFDNMNTGEKVLSKTAVLLHLAENAPIKHHIPLSIIISDSSGNQWHDVFYIAIEEIFTISGQITDRTTRKPLSGVQVSSDAEISSISDKDGRYKIHIVKLESNLKLVFSSQQYLSVTKFLDLADRQEKKEDKILNIVLQKRISLEDAGLSLVGESVRDASGAAVSYAGDVNGDGYDDILVGAWSNDDGGLDAGKAYLVLGKSGGWGKTINLDQADASFIGEKPYDEAGRYLAYAGDINKDGFDDFFIGASGNDEHGDKTGQTYLILGKATDWAQNVPLDFADASFLGQKPYDRSGMATYVGDVNGDSYDDLLFSGWSSDMGGIDSGQAYLFFGKPSGWQMDISLDLADASFLGENERDEAGKAIAWAGDVNGDGYDDFLIGAPSCNDNKDFSGKTYLFLGRPKGWHWHVNLSEADASFIGENSNDASGSALCGLGDVNGDGYDDFMIGAWSNDSAGIDAGKAYLFFGRPSGWHSNTLLLMADATFVGEETKDAAALSLSYAGDINGDGYNDILIGAWGSSYGHTDNGQTYVILGKSSGWRREMSLKEADFSYFGKNNSDFSGRALSYAGDFNSDGIDDLIIGAWGSSAGQSGAGESYLIFANKNIPPHNIEKVKLNVSDLFSIPDPLELEEQNSLYSDKFLARLEENWASQEDKSVNAEKFNQLYVVLHAEDTQPERINVAEVILNSPASVHDLSLKLYETDYNSGKFLNRIKISSTSTSSFSKRILAHGQNFLTVSSKENGAKFNKIFLQDVTPPKIYGMKPNDQERLVSITSPIVAHIKDPGSGVDKTSIKMLINDKQVQPLIEGDKFDYRLTYKPPEFFPYGHTVKVIISAGDNSSASNVYNNSYSFHVADKGILLNPGFEQDLTNWKLVNRRGVSVSIDSTIAHTGLKSLKLEFNGTEDVKYQQLSQGPIPVKPKTGYLLRCFMKTENLTSQSGMRLYVEGTNLLGRKKQNYFNAQSNEIMETTDWEEITVMFDTRSDTTNIFVYAVRWDVGELIGGTCWLDDFYLMEESEDGYTGSKVKNWLFDFFTE